jgi:hypothetical protein
MFKAAKAGPAKVVTANRLDDGIVVFLDDEGGWPVEITKARILEDGPDLDGALAYAKEQHDARVIVEPYAIDVEVKDGVPVPVRLRELIRARGPTVDYGDAERARLAAG